MTSTSARGSVDADSRSRQARGAVRSDREWAFGKPTVPGAHPWAPRWLIIRIGTDPFGHVSLVLLFAPPTDSILGHLGRLARLHVLNDASFFHSPMLDLRIGEG